MGLLPADSLRLGVPFLAAALGVSYPARFFVRCRRFCPVVELTSGLLLIVIGVLIFTGKLTWLSGQLGLLDRFVL